MSVSDLNAEQLSAWREAAKPVYDSYIRRAGQIGEEVLAEAHKLQ
jgi:TRAP-type C4-dicarboxylate transport system substrate-binding protein